MLPFALRGFDVDNGSEFLTWHLWRYFLERPLPVDLRRSRPYKKNDQAHVEQKNWTHVRQLLGYERMEGAELLQPSMSSTEPGVCCTIIFTRLSHCKAKSASDPQTVRLYAQPQTAYQRLTHRLISVPRRKHRRGRRRRELATPPAYSACTTQFSDGAISRSAAAAADRM
jgi:hypothetical protein